MKFFDHFIKTIQFENAVDHLALKMVELVGFIKGTPPIKDDEMIINGKLVTSEIIDAEVVKK